MFFRSFDRKDGRGSSTNFSTNRTYRSSIPEDGRVQVSTFSNRKKDERNPKRISERIESGTSSDSIKTPSQTGLLENGDLLERALEFFGLKPGFNEEDLKERFYFLSKKYHPDTGEFSNDSLFKELIEYRDVLQSYLVQKTFQKSNVSPGPKNSNQEDYNIYKNAREIYDFAIHEYYKITEGNPIFLKGNENFALRKLRQSLEISKSKFEELIVLYPQSIWVADSKRTLEKIEIWFKEP